MEALELTSNRSQCEFAKYYELLEKIELDPALLK